MIALLKLIRWRNLVTIIITEIIIKYVIMDYFLNEANFVYRLDNYTFIILLLSSVFVASAGNIINDIRDVEADSNNKITKRPIVSGLISIKSANILFIVSSSLGVLSSVYAAWLIGAFGNAIFQFIVLGMILMYSYRWKCRKLFGNIVVSLVTALVPALVWYYSIMDVSNNGIMFNYSLKEMHFTIFFFSLFAFISNLIREIIKDREDKKSDLSSNCKTWAALATHKVLIRSLTILLVVFSLLIFLFQIYSSQNIMFRLSFIIIHLIVYIYLIPKLRKAKDEEDFHNLSLRMKAVMLIGLSTSLLLWV